MKRKAKLLLIKIGKVVASLAVLVTAFNVNSTCMYLIHQPKLPEEASKLKKKRQ